VIDCLFLGGGCDLCFWIGWNVVVLLYCDCSFEGVLYCVFGELEVVGLLD